MTSETPYPVRLHIDYPPRQSRLLIFVKWLLAIPHFLVLVLLLLVAYIAVAISFFAVLILGRYPEGLFGFVSGVLRWSIRVSAYMYLITDAYPPFTLGDDPAYPVRVEFDYPERVARWRPLVQWLLIIPMYIGLYVLTIIAGLVAVLTWFAILVMGRNSEILFEVTETWLRWQVRVSAYLLWLTTRYPPVFE